MRFALCDLIVRALHRVKARRLSIPPPAPLGQPIGRRSPPQLLFDSRDKFRRPRPGIRLVFGEIEIHRAQFLAIFGNAVIGVEVDGLQWAKKGPATAKPIGDRTVHIIRVTIPSSIRRKASPRIAPCSRLTRKPAISRFSVTGDCPTARISAVVCTTTSGAVQGAGTISTSGIRCGGLIG